MSHHQPGSAGPGVSTGSTPPVLSLEYTPTADYVQQNEEVPSQGSSSFANVPEHN